MPFSAGVKGGEDGKGAGPVGWWLVFPGLFGDEEGFEVFGSDHGVSLFFQWFGDNVEIGGALIRVFAAIEAVGVVNAVGAVGASVQAEGVGGGVEVVRISAVDTEESAVLCDKDRRVCLGGWRCEG